MAVTLDWPGCATFRLQVDDFVIFLDRYIDRVPAAPPVCSPETPRVLASAGVDQAKPLPNSTKTTDSLNAGEAPR